MNLQDNATGFQHIGFPTNDLQETIAFYEKLGFSVALRTYNEEAGEAVAFLQLGNLMLEIYENHQASMQAGASRITLPITKQPLERQAYCCSKVCLLSSKNDFL